MPKYLLHLVCLVRYLTHGDSQNMNSDSQTNNKKQLKRKRKIMYNLTDEQANLLKDILKAIGHKPSVTKGLAAATGKTVKEFNQIADETFLALGNGRVTVQTN